ncbi:MAG: hypothetical protein JST39_18380, partial [Bacteroidetes bacterium]|nr:hypothetical protein [Bacteroidota bacterium]
GYYFREGDGVKMEAVTAAELEQMVEDVNRYSNHHIRNLIFYELDKKNLDNYEPTVFKKVLDRLD